MTQLLRAHEQLFQRSPDEQFDSFDSLWQHCRRQREESTERWPLPAVVESKSKSGSLVLSLGSDGDFAMTDWSFSQMCRLASVSKDTVNKLSAETASKIFAETLPRGSKPLQVLTIGDTIRSIHGTGYTRLYNLDVLNVVREFATDFQPPHQAVTGGTGLYAGEEDMFGFFVDPLGWIDIDGEAFAPGFFVWNSEWGRRTVGIQSFWFQKCCGNHIVWDAVDIVEFTRRHTANVHGSLGEIRRIIEQLVLRRDERRDAFAKVVENAMHEKLGEDPEAVLKQLIAHGISRTLAKAAIESAQAQRGLTIWSVVDALTRISGSEPNAGDRTDADRSASQILALAAR
jgi:hypothetical protein